MLLQVVLTFFIFFVCAAFSGRETSRFIIPKLVKAQPLLSFKKITPVIPILTPTRCWGEKKKKDLFMHNLMVGASHPPDQEMEILIFLYLESVNNLSLYQTKKSPAGIVKYS